MPVPSTDQRRLDLIVPGLNIYEGFPLFCDATILSPLSGSGFARPGTSNKGGALFAAAERKNSQDYIEVTSSGLGKLLCLAAETYGRWNTDCIQLVPLLAREHSRGLNSQIRKGCMLSYQRRWWGLL